MKSYRSLLAELRLPDYPIAARYEMEHLDGESLRVSVKRILADGEREEIFSYEASRWTLQSRKFFQQWREGKWRDYLLYSDRDYTTYRVLDLESREVVASRPFPVDSEGKEWPGLGFIPVEFRVVDPWWSSRGSEDTDSFVRMTPQESLDYYLGSRSVTDEDYEEEARKHYAEFMAATGQWALVRGTVWGDDSFMKVRYVDLSRISEGILSEMSPFGYHILPNGVTLDEVSLGLEDGEPRVFLPSVAWADLDIAKINTGARVVLNTES